MTTRHYLGIAEQLPENWSMSFPAFPGAVTTGRDFAELMMHARDALASVVAAMEANGEPIPDSFDILPKAQSHDHGDYHDPRFVLVSVEVRRRARITAPAGARTKPNPSCRRMPVSTTSLVAGGKVVDTGIRRHDGFGSAGASPDSLVCARRLSGRSMRIIVTMDEGLVARLDRLAERAHVNRSALLARGARMVLTVEAGE